MSVISGSSDSSDSIAKIMVADQQRRSEGSDDDGQGVERGRIGFVPAVKTVVFYDINAEEEAKRCQ